MVSFRRFHVWTYAGWAFSVLLLAFWWADHWRLRREYRPFETLHSVMFVANAEEIAACPQNVTVSVFPHTCAVKCANGATLERVGRLPSIRGLFIRGDAYSDDDLTSLVGLKHLRRLALLSDPQRNAGLSDNSLRFVAEHFLELETLRFVGQPKLTGETGANLRPLTKLEELRIEDCGVNSAGFALIDLPQSLRTLSVSGVDLDDASLAQISELPNLEFLDLSRTKVTGQALEELTSLKMLRELHLPKLTCTLNEIAQFEKQLPTGCRVYVEGRD